MQTLLDLAIASSIIYKLDPLKTSIYVLSMSKMVSNLKCYSEIRESLLVDNLLGELDAELFS